MLIPELPDYLHRLGGDDYKGLIIALFTLTAGFSRPFSGKLTDLVGRVPIMVFGSLVCVLCSSLYPFAHTVMAFLLIRLFHGFSTGFKPTATSAYAADLTPPMRRGEAMSALGMSGSIGMSLGPALGGWLSADFGINFLFACSVLFALLSVVILAGSLEETLVTKTRFRWRMLRIGWADVFEPLAFPPFLVMFLVSLASGCVLTIVPDFSKTLGMHNKGLFFAVYTLSSLGIRLLAGKSPDRFGRIPVLFWSALMLCFSLIMVSSAHNVTMFLFSAVLYGAAWGMNTPTLQAWTIDLVPAERRGRGLSTMFIGLEAGIGLGAFGSQWLYGNDAMRLYLPFLACAIFAAMAAVYLLWQQRRKKIVY